jgi:hypothetical protein
MPGVVFNDFCLRCCAASSQNSAHFRCRFWRASAAGFVMVTGMVRRKVEIVFEK